MYYWKQFYCSLANKKLLDTYKFRVGPCKYSTLYTHTFDCSVSFCHTTFCKSENLDYAYTLNHKTIDSQLQ